MSNKVSSPTNQTRPQSGRIQASSANNSKNLVRPRQTTVTSPSYVKQGSMNATPQSKTQAQAVQKVLGETQASSSVPRKVSYVSFRSFFSFLKG